MRYSGAQRNDLGATRVWGRDAARHVATKTIIYAIVGIIRNGEWEDNDAARRVATSSEKRENRV